MIRIFEGELGREKHLIDLDDDNMGYFPNRGELISLEINGNYDVWEVINVLFDYTIDEINVFVKRYIWPDER